MNHKQQVKLKKRVEATIADRLNVKASKKNWEPPKVIITHTPSGTYYIPEGEIVIGSILNIPHVRAKTQSAPGFRSF